MQEKSEKVYSSRKVIYSLQSTINLSRGSDNLLNC